MSLFFHSDGKMLVRRACLKIISIDSARFMASSLLNLFNDLAKGIHKIKCTHGDDNKTWESCGITYKV